MSLRKCLWLAGGALALALICRAAVSSPAVIVRHPAPSGSLAARLDWALKEAAKAGSGKGCWIGFAIRREMGEHSQMGVNVSFASSQPALEELIYGRRPAAEKRLSTGDGIGSPAGRGPEPGRRPDRELKILRELAVLMRFGTPAARRPQTISICTLSYGVSLEDLPLYWLGPAADDDSLRLLTGFYGPDSTVELRMAVVEAVALHRKPDIVVPFLERILNGRETEKLRADAAEFLGDQPDVRALDILRRAAQADASLEVRKAAISGLTEMELPAAADALIDLALHGREVEVRDEAIQGLAEKATKATVAALEQLVVSDKDVEVQKKAVSALADLPDKGGLTLLIRIARTHPLRDVRIEAIEALGNFHDPVAAKALLDIIKSAR